MPSSDGLVRKGWHFAARRTREGAERAMAASSRRLRCPGDFRAFEGLSGCYLILATFGMRPPLEAYGKFLDAHARGHRRSDN